MTGFSLPPAPERFNDEIRMSNDETNPNDKIRTNGRSIRDLLSFELRHFDSAT